MDRDRLVVLFDDYLERRLTADGRDALNVALREDAEARRLFWEYAHQHALLADVIAERRGHRLALDEAKVGPAVSPWRRVTPALLAMAAALMLAVGLALLRSPPARPAAVARLDELRGDVVIIGETRSLARAGQVVRPGEEIRTGEDSFAVVTYPDSSRLELTSDTSVRLMDADPAGGAAGKRVFLTEGVVNALISPHGRAMLFSTLQADLLARGNRFSSASVMGETRIEMEQGKALLTRKGGETAVEIEDGTYAVASPELEVFRPAAMIPAGREPAAVLDEASGPVLGLAPLEQGKILAVACSNGLVKLWDVRSRRVRGVLDAQRKRAVAVASAPDGRTLAAGYEPLGKGPDGLDGLMVWDARKQEPRRVFAGTRRASAMAFTPDGRTLAFASARPGVWVWDLPDPRNRSLDAGRERFVLGERDRVRSLALSPDGKVVAAGCLDGRVRLWDMHTGHPLRTLEGHQRDVQTLAFQPVGGLLASGSRDGTVRLWSAAGEEVRKLTGKFGEVRCLAFSPDGQTLVTGHAGLAILWDVATGQQRATLKAHKFAITALVYLDDGHTLATAGWDRTVKLWNLRPVPGGPL